MGDRFGQGLTVDLSKYKPDLNAKLFAIRIDPPFDQQKTTNFQSDIRKAKDLVPLALDMIHSRDEYWVAVFLMFAPGADVPEVNGHENFEALQKHFDHIATNS